MEALVPDDLWAVIAPLLPPEPLKRKGGRGDRPQPHRPGQAGHQAPPLVDARGTPLGLTLSGANRHDSMALAATLDAVPGVRAARRGRPRRRPDKLHADKAYDHRRCRGECRARNIKPRIARRGVETSQRLDRHRWVVAPWPGSPASVASWYATNGVSTFTSPSRYSPAP